MKLLAALEIQNQPLPDSAAVREVFLVCGFTPLHLKTFLTAHLRLFFPNDRIEIQTGLYGDLAGSLERVPPSSRSTVCVLVEWSDLDPRLGIRALGGWRSTDIPEIVESARHQSARLAHLIQHLAENVSICVSTPTLPLPPMFTTPGGQVQKYECELRAIVTSWALSLSADARVRLLSTQRLDELSPPAKRFDPKAEISCGFPYSLEHASSLAELMATLVVNLPPKKGLIIDLDDTLWAGILGEIGVDGISWDIAGHAHMHGLFQQFLASLASAGVLLAVASKNDPALVEEALARRDILLPRERIFPVEAHWGPKSASVERILKTWNIAPQDVVFIDDSPMEVAEVHAAFPSVECLVFPKNDYQAIWDLLKRLRDSFGKDTISREDEVRSRSLRNAEAFRNSIRAPGYGVDNFLRDAEAVISFSLKADVRDNRAFELINKTNQFNLNGKHFSDSQWRSFFQDPTVFLLTAEYEDKYGPLGKIAVVMGKTDGPTVHINAWVMSCRAFSRRIEHQCLRYLFKKLNADEILFDFQATPRNGPMQNFLSELGGRAPVAGLPVRKARFDAKAPALFHRIVEVRNV